MTHRKNRDLRAELVEAQLAAQQWEQRFVEARDEVERMRREHIAIMAAHRREMSATVAELRAELGQASRELLAAAKANRPITDAEIKALDAVHLWLHQGNGYDCQLITECEDFHEERTDCHALAGKPGVKWLDRDGDELIRVDIPANVFPLRGTR
jgi:hypothetical protein